MESILISACLLGSCCKYSGGSNVLPPEALAALRERYRLIPVCPEVAGGLPVPREPSERQGDRVVTRGGRDVTAEYRRGAEIALRLAGRFGARRALFKANSPSCGSGSVYDGSFTGVLTAGDGVTSEALKRHKIEIFGDYIKLIRE